MGKTLLMRNIETESAEKKDKDKAERKAEVKMAGSMIKRDMSIEKILDLSNEEYNKLMKKNKTLVRVQKIMDKENKKYDDISVKNLSKKEGSFATGGRVKLKGGGMSTKGLGKAFLKGGKA
tara:strand:- start:114 stop:476 length:363 start_codon:yes stop_codon:yes gene_type:complete